MSALGLQFRQGGIWLPDLGLWLDPHEPQAGPDRVFISHAHSDHLGAHREVILSAPTARFMQMRLGGTRIEHVLPFGETRQFKTHGSPWQITLLPAGHIFGSAMAFVQASGSSVLYTGDFKLRRGRSAEPCDPAPARGADILIMETTYGRPEYRFPPTDAVLRGVIRFCRETIDNDETPVLLGYSLGKSQELLRGLADAGLPIMLHGTVFKLTQVYEQFGQTFPPYERYQAGQAHGKVLLCPPSVANSAMLRNLGKARVAVLTGWAVDPNCRFRYAADAAFPLSDHADFPDLIEMVKLVAPKKVCTLHGFAADFAQTMRGLGFDARALSEDDQLALPLDLAPDLKAVGRALPSAAPPRAPTTGGAAPSAAFAAFAETCAAIAHTASKLEKIRLLADYLRPLDAEAAARVATWFTGVPFPSSDNKILQLGWALLRDALCAVGDIEEIELRQVYLKHSDLGETAFEVVQGRPRAGSALSIRDVADGFEQLHAAHGPTGKFPLLVQMLQHCSPPEAKFLVKIITGDLRIGLKEGLVEEAIANAFGVAADAVRQANLLLGNIGETAALACKNALHTASIVPFRPVKFMLASPENTAKAIWERMQSRAGVSPVPKESETAPVLAAETAPLDAGTRDRRDACPTLWLEDKYDGIRCQLHKSGGRVALYSRDLKNITTTFFDLAEAARRLGADVILDGEIVAMRDEVALPFAALQRRLGRREGDLFLREEIPIRFVAFDLLWLNRASQLDRPLRERRAALESLAPWPELFRVAQITPARSAAEIEAAFAAARQRNNEGLMIKDPDSVYSPGRRGLAWLKLKKALATLDCVVVGAEYGHGKRKSVLSDYTFAVRDERTGELKTIGKAYTGLTDSEIAQLTEHFLKRAVRQYGRFFEVEPDTVLEIAFDRIQSSGRHTSGLALRFPRIVRIRTDKAVAEIDTVEAARKLAAGIRGIR